MRLTAGLSPKSRTLLTSRVMQSPAEIISNVTCAFCGLACDDLTLANSATGLDVTKSGCSIATASFREIGSIDALKAAPRLAGSPVSLDRAIEKAARILAASRAPLIAGLGTDVAGAQATLALADRIGAVADHMNMPAKLRNILTLQNGGWITTTLSEIKNRADFILFIGSGVAKRFPRFFERVIWPNDAMFVDATTERKVVFLGELDASEFVTPRPVTRLNFEHASLPRIVPVLRALINRQTIDAAKFAPTDLKILQDLAAQMQQAHYGVIVWAAPDFDFPHGELAIQTIAELLKDLNRTTRFAGFPIGGSDGDFSANGTQTWQTGLPLRSRYGVNGIDYDPHRHGAAALIEKKEVDALLWISSFSAARMPSVNDFPNIVLGPPSMDFEREPDVFIPVGTPGIHHGGHFIRADKVVVMRLKKLIENDLPSVADVAGRILVELPS